MDDLLSFFFQDFMDFIQNLRQCWLFSGNELIAPTMVFVMWMGADLWMVRGIVIAKNTLAIRQVCV